MLISFKAYIDIHDQETYKLFVTNHHVVWAGFEVDPNTGNSISTSAVLHVIS